MKTWFEIKVKYPKQDEQGRVKDVTEMFLADALSFTEAEAKIYEEMGQRVIGEFQVMTIAKSKVIDIFEHEGSDTFYQCKVVYMVANADTGKERKVTNLMLVQAHNVGQAFERIKESLKNMLVTFEVPEIKESKVLEVFHHVADQVPNNLTPLSEDGEIPPHLDMIAEAEKLLEANKHMVSMHDLGTIDRETGEIIEEEKLKVLSG